jgi:uncharacterized protein
VESIDDLRDLFVLDVDGGYLFYAPLQRRALFVASHGKELRQLWTRELWRQVREMAQSPAVDIWGLESQLNRPGSAPTEAVFIPTSGCNLRCVYCYSDATHSEELLDVDQALAGLERCAHEVKKQELPLLSLRFLGGGEPTLHPELLKRCTRRLRELAEEVGVRGFVSLVSNGVMKASLAEWCAHNIDSVTISFDGPPDIQNANRKTSKGKGSYEYVARTLRILASGSAKVDVRATLREEDLPRMDEIVEHFHDHFGLTRVCLEPVNRCGRAESAGLANPLAATFSEHFIAARQRGRELGVEVEYSSAVLARLQVRFCTSVGRHFGLNPDGSIAACPEVDSKEHHAAPLMIVGSMNEGGSEVDGDQVSRLRERTLSKLDSCSHCFARYHCAGGCPLRAMRDGHGYFGAYQSMCNAVRSLLHDDLSALTQAIAPGS